MDLLDRVRPAAEDLLGRIDTALRTHGAPGGHPVWALVRQVGAMPADAFAHLALLDAEPLRDTAASLRAAAAEWPGIVASLPTEVGSEGVAAQAYASSWPAVAGDLDGLTDGLSSTGRYAAEVADWIDGSRAALAREVATCLGSREALVLRGAPPGAVDSAAILAAAEIGARVLGAVAGALDAGWQVRDRWSAALAERTPSDARPSVRIHATHRIDVR